VSPRKRVKTSDGKGVQVAFRFEPDLVARIDGHAERLAAQHPGLRFTRADAVRALLTSALDSAERDAPATEADASRRSGGRRGSR
jgi:hypothetical protein